ncbi:MAG: hypothetical protein G8345_21305 [Magnetococcales bacterium]|nr:hypothetical protein [Magnetococcales bacterium]NGZ29411.1 hypothetical protein [Magnetococcales bacterium]
MSVREEPSDSQKVQNIIRDAGGKIMGRTRLQKIAFFLEITGLGEGFTFSYRYYGPFSEELADGADLANSLGLIKEKFHKSSWGGIYSEYSSPKDSSSSIAPPRKMLLEIMTTADPIQLELAATAALLANEGTQDPWEETERRKPEKAEKGRLEKAKELYGKLLTVETPIPLPQIVN